MSRPGAVGLAAAGPPAISCCQNPVTEIGASPTTPECPASRKGFAKLPPAVGEFKQAEHPGRLVPVFVGDDGNAGGLAAEVGFDPDGLNLAHDTVLRADRKRVAAIYYRTAAFEKQPSPFLRTRHQRPLTPIKNEYRQLRLLNFALTGPVTLPLGQSPLGKVADRRLSKTRFVAIPGGLSRACLLSCLGEVRT
jgi:hypothetical protein